MNYSDFENLLSSSRGQYYEGRWAYVSEVIGIIQQNEDVHKVLELGPSFQTIVKNCDIMVKPEIDMWDCPKDNANYPEHHMIDEKIIADWTLNVEPIKTVKIPRTGDRVSKGLIFKPCKCISYKAFQRSRIAIFCPLPHHNQHCELEMQLNH
jgi:hypothetical protein